MIREASWETGAHPLAGDGGSLATLRREPPSAPRGPNAAVDSVKKCIAGTQRSTKTSASDI